MVNSGNKNQTAAYELIKEMLKVVLPQVDLEIYPNNVFCLKCVSLLHFSAELLETSKKTENNLKEIIRTKKGVTDRDADLVIVSQGSTEGDFNDGGQPKPVVITPNIVSDILTKKDNKTQPAVSGSNVYGGSVKNNVVKSTEVLVEKAANDTRTCSSNDLQVRGVDSASVVHDRGRNISKPVEKSVKNMFQTNLNEIIDLNVMTEALRNKKKCVLEGSEKSLYLQLKRQALSENIPQGVKKKMLCSSLTIDHN